MRFQTGPRLACTPAQAALPAPCPPALTPACLPPPTDCTPRLALLLQLRLSGAQLEEKREAEASLKDVQDQLEVEEDAGKRAELQGLLAEAQEKMDALMNKFAVRSKLVPAGGGRWEVVGVGGGCGSLG